VKNIFILFFSRSRRINNNFIYALHLGRLLNRSTFSLSHIANKIRTTPFSRSNQNHTHGRCTFRFPEFFRGIPLNATIHLWKPFAERCSFLHLPWPESRSNAVVTQYLFLVYNITYLHVRLRSTDFGGLVCCAAIV
jgi:hypothetical protein